MIALLAAVGIPLLHGTSWPGKASAPAIGAEGGVMRRTPGPFIDSENKVLVRQSDSPTDICTRWAQQSAVVNGTLYLYGGEATTSTSQTENTWNNNFIAMDLSKTWQIAAPSMSYLPQPSGPPSVALGSLWNSYDSLYLYGGEFSSKPAVSPVPFSLWQYEIKSGQWSEHSNPTTSEGNNSEAANQPVQRAAEGAGVSVPSLGRAWYFGGHQDGYTTEGWSQSIWRIYLKSLLEFTFPGAQNNQVNSLSDGETAGSDGVWRNVTEGGLQDEAGFPERADGILTYVPGFGAEGLLLGLAGGTNETLTQMNVIDVYDIATSTWYKQATSGPMPPARVNPCAVVAAAPDGSSYNVYMFGGQDLKNDQTQLNDMWILTTPSFTWIKVDQPSDQSVPYARAGHTCAIWDAQMIVVGGYVGTSISCDSPGIYVYDLSSLSWVEQFTALGASNSSSSSISSGSASASDSNSSGSATASDDESKPAATSAPNAENNPLNQQPAQIANATNAGGLEGSYGYEVPQIVIAAIGGASTGGATLTTPRVTATSGPLATGKAVTYTVTQSSGAIVTETSAPGNTTVGGGSGGSSSHNGPNIAAIVAGTVAGVLFLLVCYLAFCAWLYRKQLVLYKRHVNMAQTQALGEKRPAIPGLFSTTEDSDRSSSQRQYDANRLRNSESASGSGGSWAPYVPDRRGSDSLLPRTSSENGDVDDLLGGHEPSFLGVVLAPRRSLRVINQD
ncbi:hypothetical protein AAFC00_001137 [Neodothiora populina]|uniref:Kelch repeat protein n=1 Tax=Neodothiora populina TaxID=2781224 RepID=A0ABR3PMZ6_9PEZI